MGYTTEFTGRVAISPPLTAAERAKFAQMLGPSVRHNHPNAPSYYCQWEVTRDGAALHWDGGEKFYGAEQWMVMVVAALAAAGHTCNGTIDAAGEDRDDLWRLVVRDNTVYRQEGTVAYSGGPPPPQPVPLQLSGPHHRLAQTYRLGAA